MERPHLGVSVVDPTAWLCGGANLVSEFLKEFFGWWVGKEVRTRATVCSMYPRDIFPPRLSANQGKRQSSLG